LSAVGITAEGKHNSRCDSSSPWSQVPPHAQTAIYDGGIPSEPASVPPLSPTRRSTHRRFPPSASATHSHMRQRQSTSSPPLVQSSPSTIHLPSSIAAPCRPRLEDRRYAVFLAGFTPRVLVTHLTAQQRSGS